VVEGRLAVLGARAKCTGGGLVDLDKCSRRPMDPAVSRD